MKRFFKITGITLLSTVGVLAVVLLLARFAFRERILRLAYDQLQQERVGLLRAGGAYTQNPDAEYRFTYDKADTALQRVREHFRLDTLGGSTTWERTMRLGRAVARTIPHGNPDSVPPHRNAISLWEYYRQTQKPLNCRHHSIILNGLLTASGIDSRYVTCMPADSTDNDCHVVNIVWLPETRRWAMIDSDQNFYVTDQTGGLLDLRQMREYLTDGRPLRAHRLFGDEKRSDYFAYMAKNLYWFTCIEDSGFDSENDRSLRSVHLIPQGFAGYKLWGNRNNVVTSDADRFWAAPDDSDSTI